jgi:glycosyltransferase involved in cell wall biosynthesis
MEQKNLKIAIFHHFLLSHCKGGGEKLMLQMRDHLNTISTKPVDVWVGSVDKDAWDYKCVQDTFTESLSKGPFIYLAEESHTFGWKYIKRQLEFKFSSKIKELAKNDIVLFSFGNIAFVPQRVKKYNPNCKTIAYVNTPPRIFTDQFDVTIAKMAWYKKPLFRLFTKIVLFNFNNAVKACDHVITNSENIKKRVQKYCDITADSVIFPLVDVKAFYSLPSEDFYHSHARLEPMKRLDMIVKAFEKMPDKKLVITSGGPMQKWITDYISEKDIKNIDFKGRVSDEERDKIMATCLAGIYIPIDEDAGITQLEFMACGKPVIGVKDGGLIESVIDGKTGILMSKNPTVEELINTIETIEKEKLIAMDKDCKIQAAKFDKSIFFDKFDQVIKTVLE